MRVDSPGIAEKKRANSHEAWPIRVRLTFDNRGQLENIDDFPILIVLSLSRVVYKDIAAVSEDIRFIDGNTGLVSFHKIDNWNPVGRSHLWVWVPPFDGRSGNGRI